MPFYHKLGEIPRVKHTTFYKPDGKSLYREEMVSSKGFSGVYTTKYHHHLPTKVLRVTELTDLTKNVDWPDAPVVYYHFFTDKKKSKGNFINSRNVFLRNSHCSMATAHVTEDTDDFYRNSYGTEYVLIHHGKGVCKSDLGEIQFDEGDQFIIPRAMTHQFKFDDYSANNKMMIVESDTSFEIPRHYISEYGQLDEIAPYSERDFKIPENLETHDESGEFRIIVKMGHRFFEHIVPHHPYGVVGWDGYLYPFAFNIRDYHPKVGRIHLPPPVHLAFRTQHFILCNFVPRPFDFYPGAIPVPYFHSNIDSDEVLYYFDGDFLSRTGVVEGSITLHPGGMPHGPQPGRTEASLSVRETKEYAVMVDTYEPLKVTSNVKETLDEEYSKSWLSGD